MSYPVYPPQPTTEAIVPQIQQSTPVTVSARFVAFDSIISNIRREEKNVNLWFGIWSANKDYSGVMNASFAIGKLASLIDTAMFSFADVNKGVLPYLEELSEKNRQNMGAISAGVGRIVPYRPGTTSM